jgi:hypothetical protein
MHKVVKTNSILLIQKQKPTKVVVKKGKVAKMIT